MGTLLCTRSRWRRARIISRRTSGATLVRDAARARGSLARIRLALAQADSVALGQAIERAAMDSEELGGELLVPARLAQHPADVASHDAAQAQRRAGAVGRGHRPHALRREIFRADDRARRQRHGALDGVLELADVPGP